MSLPFPLTIDTDGRQQVDYLSLLNDMLTDETKNVTEDEKRASVRAVY